MGYFDKIFAYLYMSTLSRRIACITTLFDGRGFAEHQLKMYGQLLKMLKTLEPRGIYGSNFVCLCILK